METLARFQEIFRPGQKDQGPTTEAIHFQSFSLATGEGVLLCKKGFPAMRPLEKITLQKFEIKKIFGDTWIWRRRIWSTYPHYHSNCFDNLALSIHIFEIASVHVISVKKYQQGLRQKMPIMLTIWTVSLPSVTSLASHCHLFVLKLQRKFSRNCFDNLASCRVKMQN